MVEKENFLLLEGFKKATFTIDGKTKDYSILKLAELYKFLGDHLKTCADLAHTLDFYREYEKKIDGLLDKDEKYWKEDKYKEPEDVFQYNCGGNYADYVKTSRKIGEGILVADNGKAGDILEAEFKKLYPDNTLLFDTESSYCYVYTSNREEAKTFLLYVYNKYIKVELKGWYAGWEDFVEEWSKATDDEKWNLKILEY